MAPLPPKPGTVGPAPLAKTGEGPRAGGREKPGPQTPKMAFFKGATLFSRGPGVGKARSFRQKHDDGFHGWRRGYAGAPSPLHTPNPRGAPQKGGWVGGKRGRFVARCKGVEKGPFPFSPPSPSPPFALTLVSSLPLPLFLVSKILPPGGRARGSAFGRTSSPPPPGGGNAPRLTPVPKPGPFGGRPGPGVFFCNKFWPTPFSWIFGVFWSPDGPPPR